MKLFFVTILVLSIFSANAQLFSGIDNDESSFIAIQTQNEIDTIRKFAFKIKLLDSKIIKDNEVIFVIEKPTDFHYYRFKKEKEGWLQNNSTGTIAINSKYSSRTMRNYAISSSFKIIAIDQIFYKTTSGNEIIFNCEKIRQRNIAMKSRIEAEIKKQKGN